MQLNANLQYKGYKSSTHTGFNQHTRPSSGNTMVTQYVNDPKQVFAISVIRMSVGIKSTMEKKNIQQPFAKHTNTGRVEKSC